MKFRKILMIVLIVFLFNACSSFLEPKETSTDDNYGNTTEESEGMVPSFTNDEIDQANKDITSSPNEKLIQNIGLELETKEYTKTVSDIEALVRSLNGYIQSSYVPRPRNDVEFNNLEANLTVMIPTSSIEDFILKAGATSNIVNERREVYNVTDVYRDTESRITTLKAKELRLLELLQQSGLLSDLLMIETELSNTRYEIERLESSIQDYDTRIKYTQFTLTIREVYEYSPSDEASLWERIVEGFTSNAQSFIRTLETGFVYIVTTLPFLIIQLLLWCSPLFIVFLIYRKLSKKHNFRKWFNRKVSPVKNQEEEKKNND
ncbi:MAG TPA: DUF4349 domain-containing protein [Erysipelotrichaceae bacterium]|nr:DUF4349 domain-containing protein [Erysipelotrichaceae bacterium]